MKYILLAFAGLSALSLGLRRDTEPVFYVFRRADQVGLARVIVNRPKERMTEHVELYAAVEGSRVVGLRVTSDERLAVLAFERADRDNVWVVDPAASEGERLKRFSLPGTPNVITSNDEDAFIACGASLTRIDVESDRVRERRTIDAARSIDALARFDDDGLVLATCSNAADRSSASPTSESAPSLAVFDEDDLELEFQLLLPELARRFDLLAVSDQLGIAACAARENSALVLIDLDEAEDSSSKAVIKALNWNKTPGATTQSICISADDGRTAFLFGSGECAAIDLETGTIHARIEAPNSSTSSFHLATPRRAITVGPNTDAVFFLGFGAESKLDLRRITLTEPADLIAPVEPLTCVQVVALSATNVSLVRIDLERVNHTLPTFGTPLAIASPFDR